MIPEVISGHSFIKAPSPCPDIAQKVLLSGRNLRTLASLALKNGGFYTRVFTVCSFLCSFLP